MAKIKFPLEMSNGVQARTLNDLKENFDIEKVIGYFLDGKLQTWLDDRYYEDEAEAISCIDKKDAELSKKLCKVFGVEYLETQKVDIEKIAEKNARIEKLKQFTDDEEIIKNVDLVAFNQEELGDLYDAGALKIYLCEGAFDIPKSKQDLQYIEIGNPKVSGKKVLEKDVFEYKSYRKDGITKLRRKNLTKNTEEELLDETESLVDMKVVGDLCVYRSSNTGLYFSTPNETVLVDDKGWLIDVSEDMIIYKNDSNEKIYSYNLTTRNKEELFHSFNDPASIYIDKYAWYYIDRFDLKKYDFLSNSNIVLSENVYKAYFYGNDIYMAKEKNRRSFLDADNYIAKFSLKDNKEIEVFVIARLSIILDRIQDIIVKNDKIVYSYTKDDRYIIGIYSLTTKNTNEIYKEWSDYSYRIIDVENDWIYLYKKETGRGDFNDSSIVSVTHINKMRCDGTEFQRHKEIPNYSYINFGYKKPLNELI